jgi:tRNA-binding protein
VHVIHDPTAAAAEPIDFGDFLKVDIRIGTILTAEALPEARKPSYRLRIDFGPALGEKKSVAQIVARYSATEIVGRQVAAVVNFPPRQIGPAISEVLTLGFADEAGEVVLFAPDSPLPNGSRLF